ncbi:hypothetical protein G3I01_11150 [Gramella sp. MT6]|uniref:hypothetical protein n=1 Tax=Gramella sp. MT6 TaxID=2705471 RepID=UPI001C6046FE|nr:hypothetical protein [Gramella sp. MT6]QYA26049.1 hypothetical protein G3I01_11150 [Gramella sp. MT6]
MRKIGLSIFVFVVIIACSKEPIEVNEFEINEVNYSLGKLNCQPTIYNLDDFGEFKIESDESFIYITISSFNPYLLDKFYLHYDNDLKSFPLVGKGNLPPGNMKVKINLDPNSTQFDYQIPISENYNELTLSSLVFFDGPHKLRKWVGDMRVNFGNWKYFNYELKNCYPCALISAGNDNSTTLNESEARAIPNKDRVKLFYLDLLDDGVPTNGIFEPTIDEIISNFANNPIGEFKTKYTIEEGECMDSVFLTLYVIPDDE